MTTPPSPLRVALAQMQSGPDPALNLAFVEEALVQAAAKGAGLLALPENALHFAPTRERLAAAEPLDGPRMARLRALARQHEVALLIGSIAERESETRAWNTLVLIDGRGALVSTYRKMHLFDVALGPENTFCESAHTPAGEAKAIVAELEGWRIGLSICYDLRFPELYRALAMQGAHALVVPAAFTVPTGRAHWEILLRARAIENLSWVLAPAQTGRCYGKRESHGHSMVVDPWGEIVAARASDPGLIFAELDPERLAEVRRRLPALQHARLMAPPI